MDNPNPFNVKPPLASVNTGADEVDLSNFPIPSEEDKFAEVSTDDLFSALMMRIQIEKAKLMLSRGYTQFMEISKRATPQFAINVALQALAEVGDGKVRAAYTIETQKSSPTDRR